MPTARIRYLTSLCRSVNEVICHGIPDQRKLQEGDIVNIDVTLYYDGIMTSQTHSPLLKALSPRL